MHFPQDVILRIINMILNAFTQMSPREQPGHSSSSSTILKNYLSIYLSMSVSPLPSKVFLLYLKYIEYT